MTIPCCECDADEARHQCTDCRLWLCDACGPARGETLCSLCRKMRNLDTPAPPAQMAFDFGEAAE